MKISNHAVNENTSAKLEIFGVHDDALYYTQKMRSKMDNPAADASLLGRSMKAGGVEIRRRIAQRRFEN